MYSIHTPESLHAYADRLHREAERSRQVAGARRGSVRTLLRRVRPTS